MNISGNVEKKKDYIYVHIRSTQLQVIASRIPLT